MFYLNWRHYRDICTARAAVATLAFAMSRPRMGQHFLADPGWRQRILETLPLRAGETWLEIGAGHGEMTRLLAGEGRRVAAIEADARLAASLRERAKREGWPGVEIIAADALALDWERLIGGRFHVYGNLPYYITSPILHRLFRAAGRIATIHIVLQLEVAARLAAQPGRRDYGYLSAACQFYARPQILKRIPPGAFRPPPRVASALVGMTLPGERASLNLGDEGRFLEFVQTCFGQKRKTLRNNLRGLISEERAREAFAACGMDRDVRAEQLSLARFAELFAQLESREPRASLTAPAGANPRSRRAADPGNRS